jgi:chemotaxis protein CheC
MSNQTASWGNIITGPQSATLLQAAMTRTARNLSEMIGRPVTIDVVDVEAVPIVQVMTYVGSPEAETAGAYLLIEGDLNGQAILMLPLEDAMHMVDLLLDNPPGTTTHLDDLGRSALAEVGNVTVASFLNEVAAVTGVGARPSPPVVIVDMLGAILTVVVTPLAAVSDDILIVKTVLKETERVVQAHFWILPEPTMVTFGKVSIHPGLRVHRD